MGASIAVPLILGGINAIAGANDQAQGSAAVDEAADIARQNYQQTAGLRSQAIARMMARQPTAPNLTGIVTDTRNPYNTTFASPANEYGDPGPDYSAAQAEAAALPANKGEIQMYPSNDVNSPYFGQNSQIATGNYAGLASLDPIAGSPAAVKGPTPVYDSLQSVPAGTKLTAKQVADLQSEALATNNSMAAIALLREHGQAPASA